MPGILWTVKNTTVVFNPVS